MLSAHSPHGPPCKSHLFISTQTLMRVARSRCVWCAQYLRCRGAAARPVLCATESFSGRRSLAHCCPVLALHTVYSLYWPTGRDCLSYVVLLFICYCIFMFIILLFSDVSLLVVFALLCVFIIVLFYFIFIFFI